MDAASLIGDNPRVRPSTRARTRKRWRWSLGFYADLHIHSKFSRATSRDCDLEHLAASARRKGIRVLGTGDFTHPGWLREIEEKLVPAEPGLFRLRPDLEGEVDRALGGRQGDPVRFLLSVEISTIYKKGDRTRKVHHVILVPGLDAARKLSRDLARIGNLASDGRPILGLDSRDLLETVLGAGEGPYLIPAHIWTPWFAVLGSSSGFDSVEECYGDLSGAIFAVETGLSSDPPMNRRLSALDRFALVSNSDAHSPGKLGREACVFETDLDYFAMRRALETRRGYAGTVEFFAEEGKYHLDGHRKCGVRLHPDESRRRSDLCPVCGKPLTLGVLHRVMELADRDEGMAFEADGTPFRSLIPLEEVLGEVRGTGPGSKAVRRLYDGLVARLGPELPILESVPLEEVERAASPLVAEALRRMREGRVIREGGYDGEYGRIRLFEDGELERERGEGKLLEIIGLPPARPEATPPWEDLPASAAGPLEPEAERAEGELPETAPAAPAPAEHPGVLGGLDPEQRAAAEAVEGTVSIIAGPGTGKTRTLTRRIAHLVLDLGVPPERCLAIAFTRRAAAELIERLDALLGAGAGRVQVLTFHSLGLSILRAGGDRLGLPERFRIATELETRRLLREVLGVSDRSARKLLDGISRLKRGGGAAAPDPEAASALPAFERALREGGLVDFDDLVVLAVRLLEEGTDIAGAWRSRYGFVSVDEGQDMDPLQYRLVRLLVPPGGNLCAIGDPDQSIYGFRGADAGCFLRLPEDFPGARTFLLGRSYRSSRAIVEAAGQMIAPATLVPGRRLEAPGERVPSRLQAQSGGSGRIEVHERASDLAEADFIVREIERMVGGSSFLSAGSGGEGAPAVSFADIAVLCRTNSLFAPIVEAFRRSGIPFQLRSHAPLAGLPCIGAVVEAMESILRERPGDPVPDLLESAAARAAADDPEMSLYLDSLRSLARRHSGDARAFLDALALGIDCDLWDPRAQAVSLLTLHAAKGLEFETVFIAGCEDGIIPLPGGEGDDPAEERRLLYVGMTRARRRLVLTRALRRAWRGPVRPTERSPFLAAIGEGLLEIHRHAGDAAAGPRPRQLTLFEE
jgi:DNA helicase-2/ATP-dependent DNA helicase PcrA